MSSYVNRIARRGLCFLMVLLLTAGAALPLTACHGKTGMKEFTIPETVTTIEATASIIVKKEAAVKAGHKVGDKVKKGDIICILEAMKMENEIFAPKSGTVAQVLVQKGATVDTGATMVVLN